MKVAGSSAPVTAGKSRLGGTVRLGVNGIADLDRQLDELPLMSLPALRTKWKELHDHDAPARLGPEFLRRAVAYRVQELGLGGLSREAELRLKALMRRARGNANVPLPSPRSARVKQGTRFLREWQGRIHEVQVIADGKLSYEGKTYRSLTVIARQITGTHQSGPRFFGLRIPDSVRTCRRNANG